MHTKAYRLHRSSQNFQCFLKTLDLLLAHATTLLIPDLDIDALRFELVVVIQGLAQDT